MCIYIYMRVCVCVCGVRARAHELMGSSSTINLKTEKKTRILTIIFELCYVKLI
jgi:hypothetical protein